MEASVLTRDRLRRLASLRPDRGRVLSVFLGLDPSTFGTAEARASQITSVLDDAHLARGDKELIEERRNHLRNVADELLRLLKASAFDRLAVAGAEPTATELEAELHPYVRERLSGRLHLEAHATPAEVLAVARPLFHQIRAEHENELLERLRAGLGRDDGSAVAGAQPVIGALTERRVETLLLHPAALQDHELLEPAVELALEQAAEIVSVADTEEVDGLAALLRF